MISGAYSESQLSGITGGGASTHQGMWNSPPSKNSMHGSTMGIPSGGGSYNPFAEEDDPNGSQRMAQLRGGVQGNAGLPPINRSSGSVYGDGYAESVASGKSGKSHHGLRKKLKEKLSRSHLNLHAAAKAAGGDKIYADNRHSVISVSNHRDHQLPDSTSGGNPRLVNGSTVSLSQDPSEYYTEKDGRPSGARGEMPSAGSNPQSMDQSGGWGLHAEERPSKPLEEANFKKMSHREIVNYAMQLERTNQVSRAELLRVQGERNELNKRHEEVEKELDSVRSALAELRFRLLTAGMTDFLEQPASPAKALSLDINPGYNSYPETNGSDSWGQRHGSVGGWKPTISSTQQDSPQSFLDKLSALTSNNRRNGATQEPIEPAPQNSAPVSDWW